MNGCPSMYHQLTILILIPSKNKENGEKYVSFLISSICSRMISEARIKRMGKVRYLSHKFHLFYDDK